MKHITQQYGEPCNDLELTTEEFKIIEPFLRALGIRSRTVVYEVVDGTPIHRIQAENVYKSCIGDAERKFADTLMSEASIGAYQR